MLDLAIFLIVLLATSYIVYKVLGVLWKVFVWGAAIFIAYVLLKVFVFK